MDIRNCNIKYQCPKTWNSLEESFEDNVRFCGECKKNVHFCKDEYELMVAMKNDWCVAIPIEPIVETEQQDFLEGMELKLNNRSPDEILMGDIDFDPCCEAPDK